MMIKSVETNFEEISNIVPLDSREASGKNIEMKLWILKMMMISSEQKYPHSFWSTKGFLLQTRTKHSTDWRIRGLEKNELVVLT